MATWEISITGFSTRLLCPAIAALFLSNCAQTELTPPSRATVMNTTRVGPGCGPDEAKRLSAEAASYTTLKRGYAGYVILAQGDEIRQVGGPPPGAPGVRSRVAGETEEHMLIMMFHSADPNFSRVIDARKELGPRWSSIIQLDFPTTCTEA